MNRCDFVQEFETLSPVVINIFDCNDNRTVIIIHFKVILKSKPYGNTLLELRILNSYTHGFQIIKSQMSTMLLV